MKILVIGLVFPEPNTTAAGWRMIQLLKILKKHGAYIHYTHTNDTKNAQLHPKYIDKINKVEVNDSSFDTLLKEINPTIVVYERFVAEEQFGWRVKQHCPNAMTILDTEDLHFLRYARAKQYQNKKDLQLQNKIFYREITSILKCDLSLIISKFELDLLINEFKIPKKQLCYLPFLWDGHFKEPHTSFNQREHLISIGNFFHEPNKKMVLELFQKWDLFRKKLPNLEIHCYGAYADEQVLKCHNPNKGFYIKGHLNELTPTLHQYKIMIATVPFGAGLKGKIFDALVHKIPVISNDIGWEGYPKQHLNPLLIANNDEELINNIKMLNENEDFYQLSTANYQKVLEEFRIDKYEDTFIKVIHDIKNNIDEHRAKHYLINLLHQEHLMSKKYMSLWIEEKNG